MDVKAGDRVTQGQVVAAVDATGRATGPHLHWGMSWFDVLVDPQLVLDRIRYCADRLAFRRMSGLWTLKLSDFHAQMVLTDRKRDMWGKSVSQNVNLS